MALVEEGRILLLEIGGVPQHGVAQVGGRRRSVDRRVVTVLGQRGQIAAVIHVRMREDHTVHRRRREGKLLVALGGFLPAALIKPAV